MPAEEDRMSDYAIRIEGLCVRYQRKQALDNLNLALEAGCVHAVVGANGAGKSSLFRVLLGFQGADAGNATVLGCDSRALTPALRGRIGFVNEEHSLPGWMRVDELTALQRRQYPRWNDARFDEVIRNFNVEPKQKVGSLSRGERAGVSLALALAQSPELLMLDEPTLGLDIVAKRAFMESLMLANLSERMTIVYCSHQMDEIERLADNLVIMERGVLRFAAPPHELCARVQMWVADFGGAMPEVRALPGVLRTTLIEGLLHLTVFDRGDAFGDELRQLGARNVQAMDVNLGSAIDGMLSRGHISNQPLPKAA
jgi:ABC-2 type transport system ATP-binding protein